MKLSQAVIKSLRELVDLAGGDVGEVEVEKRFFGWRIRVSKGSSGAVVQTVAPAPAAPAAPAAAPAPAAPPQADEGGAEEVVEGPTVNSPMVGTFYRSPSPDAGPFVKEGDVVTAGQTVCIIEAMKIMNEIEAEIGGRVAKVLVENGSPVEYNTPLFLIEPS